MAKDKTTKERLLAAACSIFSEKGYRDTTVAEICEAADANIAAVNYHFGDKESLYDAVWRYAFGVAVAAYPLDWNLPDNPSVEDAIYSYASAILHRIFSDGERGYFAKLLHYEMAAPTLALDRISEEVLIPQHQFLDQLIKDSLGEDIDDRELLICKHSIIGQCAFFNFSRPLRERVLGKVNMTEDEMNRAARHIARFSLGGLKELKR